MSKKGTMSKIEKPADQGAGHRSFTVMGHHEAPGRHHYTACGLDNIYLSNGFEVRETKRGRSVAIKDIEGLHKAIGQSLIEKRERLTGKEFRFLRLFLGLTQAGLADQLGSDVQNIGRYERGESEIPGPADKLLRMFVYVRTCSGEELDELIAALEEKAATEPSSAVAPDRVFEHEQHRKIWHGQHAH